MCHLDVFGVAGGNDFVEGEVLVAGTVAVSRHMEAGVRRDGQDLVCTTSNGELTPWCGRAEIRFRTKNSEGTTNPGDAAVIS